MSIQHFNEVKAIARTAKQLGAPLPERIAKALAHLEDLTRSTPTSPRPGTIAVELAHHLGDPVTMAKALKASATTLASAEAAAKIHHFLAEACGARVRAMMRGQAEQIAQSFGDALADDLATLSRTAGKLPAWFNPEQAASLDATTFEAWTQAANAYARITSTQGALAPLYSGAIQMHEEIHFPTTAAASLRFAKPPKLTNTHDAYAFRDALSGRTERVQGLASQGSTFVDGLFIPTALAHTGSTFEWATPAAVSIRVQIVTSAMVQPDPVRA